MFLVEWDTLMRVHMILMSSCRVCGQFDFGDNHCVQEGRRCFEYVVSMLESLDCDMIYVYARIICGYAIERLIVLILMNSCCCGKGTALES